MIDRIEDAVERIQAISKDLNDQQLNWKPDPKRWSIGQTFDHMLIAANPYLPEIKLALATAQRAPADPEVEHSWFGKFVIRAAGPKGNAPVPKSMVPGSGVYRHEIVDRWLARHQEIIDLARHARGIDLVTVSIRNPVVKMFKLNLADVFEILAAHAERHVGQIEALHRSLPKPADPRPDDMPQPRLI